MKAKQNKATCQDKSPNSTVNLNHLPDEVLLEIFDFYRRSIDPYDHQWRKKYVWLNLAHVSRKWRDVMLASSFRLDLGITVGSEEPDHIKTILSGPLPIFIDYKYMYGGITGSALWRMRAALGHHDRVREISFEGTSANFDEFFKETNCALPVLESLVLRFGYHYHPKFTDISLPDAFLGPDLSDPHLRRLRLERVSLASISRFLLSATALTDLFLRVDTVFGPSPEMSLLSCLQGMPCLRSLDLSILFSPLESPSQPSTPKGIASLSKLTYFRYDGQSIHLNALAGISAPSLRDIDIQFIDTIWPPNVHLPRFVNETEEQYHAVHLTFGRWNSQLSLLTQSEYISHSKPRFNVGSMYHCREAMMQTSGALSTRLSTVEDLRVTFDKVSSDVLEHFFPWRRFFQQFPCVKALRTEGADDSCIARILLQNRQGPDDDLAFLPALEELELGKNLNPSFTHERQTRSRRSAMLAYERQTRARMEAIQPFTSARQQVGRPVKVSFRP